MADQTTPEERPRHSIGVVSRRTGLSAHVLRAWERRYGIVQPGRSAGGERLYSDADVERLELIQQALAAGRRVGHVATLSLEELRDLVSEDARSAPPVPAPTPQLAPPVPTGETVADYLACLDAIQRLDGNAVHTILMRAVVALSPVQFVETMAVPLLHEVGHLWEKGEIRPAHEHVLSVAIRRVLSWLMDALPVPPGAPGLLIATPAGFRHEFGAMLAGVIAAGDGWRVTYLGPDLPADDIAAAARLTLAEGVVLSAIGPIPAPVLRRELHKLREALPSDLPLAAGGSAVAHLRDAEKLGVNVLGDYTSFRDWMRALKDRRGPALQAGQ